MQVIDIHRRWENSTQPLPTALGNSKRMKVLVPYDGSENADVALADLRLAGLPDDLEGFVAVTDVWLPASPAEITSAVNARRMLVLTSGISSFAPALRNREEQQALLAEATHRLQSDFPFATIKSEALSDTFGVTSAMLRKAEQWRVNLITVGSKRSPSPQISDFASAALRMAAKSDRSVRFARPSSRTAGSPARIMAGIDGSRGIDQAVQSIAERVWPEGSQVRAVMIHRPSPQNIVANTNAERVGGNNGHRELDAAFVEEVRNKLRAAGLSVSIVVKSGVPEDLLLQEAREWGADCVYVDAQGFSSTRSSASGLSNFARAVALGADCSVEVVRNDPESPDFLMTAA